MPLEFPANRFNNLTLETLLIYLKKLYVALIKMSYLIKFYFFWKYFWKKQFLILCVIIATISCIICGHQLEYLLLFEWSQLAP